MKTTLQDFNLSNNKITFLASLSLKYFNRKKEWKSLKLLQKIQNTNFHLIHINTNANDHIIVIL